MIWVAVIGDWFNLIFKWILFGHRPYWWVQETMIYPNQSSPCLEQFPITCETGPGSPSGHAMGSSCVWYVMVTAALSYTVRQNDKSAVTLHRLTWSFLWTVFWIIQISVCISRVFIATHFPHQVILGVFAGILVAEAFEHTPAIQTASLRMYIKTNLFLFIFALGFYLVLKLLDIDLLWSVPKAMKWCANPDWINIDTTPFAGLVRNLEQQMKKVVSNEIISAYHHECCSCSCNAKRNRMVGKPDNAAPTDRAEKHTAGHTKWHRQLLLSRQTTQGWL